MLKTSHRLMQVLRDSGIQPSSFAYFLHNFIKANPEIKNPAGKLLNKSMKAQAELIAYHLEH